MLTQLAYKHYGDAVKDVMPALGCHEPVTEEQREQMFGIVPPELFRVHNWREDVVTVCTYTCSRKKFVQSQQTTAAAGLCVNVERDVQVAKVSR